MTNKSISLKLPLTTSPLVHCITNEITCESVANALLYVGAKPIMAADDREFAELFEQTDALLLNVGHLSPEREATLRIAAHYAQRTKKPTVVDIVGYGVSRTRNEVCDYLIAQQPTIVKGNSSECRKFCGLTSLGKGVDASAADQGSERLAELKTALRQISLTLPTTTFVATGEIDLVVTNGQVTEVRAGVAELDQFTGTGDIVGGLMAAFLTGGISAHWASQMALLYFGKCGEIAKAQTTGLADFRTAVLNQLSLFGTTNAWQEKGEEDADSKVPKNLFSNESCQPT